MCRQIRILAGGFDNSTDRQIKMPDWFDGESSVESAADVDAFIEKIKHVNYNLVVLNGAISSAMISEFLNVLRQSRNQDIPVFLINLSNVDAGEVQHKFLPEGHKSLSIRRRFVEVSGQTELDTVISTAATLSHEINNPLMSIAANAEMLLSRYDFLADDIVSKIRAIAGAASRIQTVVDGLSNLESLRYRNTASGRMIDIDQGGIREVAEGQRNPAVFEE